MGSDYGFVTRDEMENTEARLAKDIRENRDRINEHAKDISRLEALYQALEGLPETIAQLDRTLTVMGENMKNMNEKINDVRESISSMRSAEEQRDERIKTIDNKSKIDWQTAITQNFWKIISALLGGWIVLKFVIESIGS